MDALLKEAKGTKSLSLLTHLAYMSNLSPTEAYYDNDVTEVGPLIMKYTDSQGATLRATLMNEGLLAASFF